MSKQPVRLHKVEDNHVSPLLNNSGWIFLHPAAIIIAMLITVIILSALVFAVSGGSAVESGSMRNFLASGA